MSEVLVLNADGQPMSIIPLSVISWKEAVKLAFLDKVSILEVYEGKTISSPSVSMAMPCVVMTKKYYTNIYTPEYNKDNLLYRDDFTCQYCDEIFLGRELTIDHVIPKAHGGKKIFTNTVLACRECNQKKADKYMKPIKAPHKPTYFELVNKRKKHPLIVAHPVWQEYVLWDESLVTVGNKFKKYHLPDEKE
jgi:5-methylcytosine-specific restriction endonuclease McrA